MARVKQVNPKRAEQNKIKGPIVIKPRRITPIAVSTSPPSETALPTSRETTTRKPKSDTLVEAMIARIIISFNRQSTYRKGLKTIRRMDAVLGGRV